MINYTEFINDLKNNKLKHVYLFYGDERFLLNDALNRMKAKLLNGITDDMNYTVLEDLDSNIIVDIIIENCDTLPFMSEYRMIVVKDEESMSKLDDKDSKRLFKYIEGNINKKENRSILIFVMNEKVDTRKKIYKLIDEVGDIVFFEKLKFEEAVNYTGYFVRRNGKTIKKTYAEYIVKNVGTDLYTIVNEINKITAYNENVEIGLDDVKEILSRNINENIFNLVSSIGMKKEIEALRILNRIISIGEAPIVILAMIIRQIRIIAKAKYCEGKSLDKKSLASYIGVPLFALNDIIKQSKFFSAEELIEAFKECLNCDIALKSSSDGRMVLELLIKKLCK